MVVLPVPRGPQNRYAWLKRPSVMACSNVETICRCPTTLSNVNGRYLR
ncbi:unknown [Collinsella sp. CAG:398]|nr:unknown [Collinsella sp. CAG:398]